MTAPARLRLSRARGFDLQAHSLASNGRAAVNVARPGLWGNPFVVGKDGTREDCVRYFSLMLQGLLLVVATPTITEQTTARRHFLDKVEDLRGKNLACWCAIDGKPCDADLLLQLANAPRCDEVQL